MLKDVPPLFRKREPRVRAKAAVPPPGPVLASATYASATYVELVFDRAVVTDAFDFENVRVTDGGEDTAYVGYDLGPADPDPRRVRVELRVDHPSSPPGVHLTVPADNGLVAVDDGAAWAGVTALALPFA